MTPNDILQLIHDENIEYLDLRITDSKGKEHHISYPADIDEDFFEEGKMFDGSSFAGWKGIHNSDMILMPDPATAFEGFFRRIYREGRGRDEYPRHIFCHLFQGFRALLVMRDGAQHRRFISGNTECGEMWQ